MPRTNRLDRFAFGFLQNSDFLFLAKPTLLHFVLPFFFAQNSTFATSSFSVSGQRVTIWAATARRLVNETLIELFKLPECAEPNWLEHLEEE
jgi:hypothetical protein